MRDSVHHLTTKLNTNPKIYHSSISSHPAGLSGIAYKALLPYTEAGSSAAAIFFSSLGKFGIIKH
jgi:hypothetical protein